MIRLASVIHDAKTNSVEATWVDEISPAVEVPESIAPDTLDEEGNIIPGIATPAHTIPAVQVQVKCHAYADVQMGMFRADVRALGGNIAEHEALIAAVEAAIVPVVRLLPEVQADLKRRVTEKRDQVQFGGADVGGVRIKTDPGSIALLDQALLFSGRKPSRVFKVKNESGQHMAMTAAQIGGVFDVLGERVALCWDAEAAHYAAIDALPTVEAALAYDINTGWPA